MRLQSRSQLPVLFVATALLTLAATGTLLLTMQRQRAMATSDRYRVVFELDDAHMRLLRLRSDIAIYETSHSAKNLDLVGSDIKQLNKEVKHLRDLLADGNQGPQALATFAELTRDLDSITALLTDPAPTAIDPRLPHMLASSDTNLARLTNAVFWRSSADAAIEEGRLTRLYWACSLLIITLVSCTGMLIWLLVRQRRRAVEIALHDHLTGLPNRLLFRRRVEEVLQLPATQESGISVMFLDLDDFKDVNDSLGHVAGDALLCALTSRLKKAVPNGVVARLGGDEFAVMLPKGGRSAAAEFAEQLSTTLSEPVELPMGVAATTVSIGIATRKCGGDDDAGVLLQQADLAMYEAKALGRGSRHFFDEALSARLQLRLAMEADIRFALGNNQFHLVYQPLIDLKTHRTTGFEALLRWTHPERGAVSPATFIPVAEATGLIVPLGEYVLRHACKQAALWPGDIKVAVNLSPNQFKTDLVDLVQDVLAESGLSPQRLELEITESALLQDGESVQTMLRELRALGVRLALDDFGTGYSSLSYLQKYPFDKIKVDQSFVRSMSQRPESAAIVELISALARRLGMTTTAEGIEEEELLRLVEDAGCTEGQGYFFAKPLHPDAAMARLQHQMRTPPMLIHAEQSAAN